MRTSISMPPQLFLRGLERQHSEGFSCFSDYVQHLVRADYVRATGKRPESGETQIEVAA